jgi:hypothetical protein
MQSSTARARITFVRVSSIAAWTLSGTADAARAASPPSASLAEWARGLRVPEECARLGFAYPWSISCQVGCSLRASI